MPAIQQIVAGFSRGDAITNTALRLRKLFRAKGYESDIFSEPNRILPELRGECRDISAVAAAQPLQDTVTLLHLSIGSSVNDIFKNMTGPKAILYHNITPDTYFRGLQEQTAANLAWGREQLRDLAGTADLSMAVSRYNAQEMESVGHRNVQVTSLPIEFSGKRGGVENQGKSPYSDGKTNLLFVGRCAPNKKIEDILLLFSHYRVIDPHARLILVGSWQGMEKYQAMLTVYARSLDLDNVVFTGSIRQKELDAIYGSASIFVCMSEHEGFCAPLLEAMYHGIPVVAFDAGAVSGTLNGAGVLFRKKQYPLVAEMINRLTIDTAFRNAVVARQNMRLDEYLRSNPEESILNALASIIPPRH